MSTTGVAVVAAAIVLYAAVSRRVLPLPLTMPMVFTTLGVLASVSGLLSLQLGEQGIELLAETALAVILFSDASRISLRMLRRFGTLPLRLLVVGLPLTVGFIAAGAAMLLPSLSVAAAALVAAILAPTDAALGQAVVEDEAVPLRVRQTLNVESGLNDGLVLPAVLAFLAIAAGETPTPGEWLAFAARAIGVGAILGAAVGVAGAALLLWAQRRDWLLGLYAQLAVLALALLAFSTATLAGGNGFVAAFVAGLAVGGLTQHTAGSGWGSYTEDTGQLLAALSFFVFGNLLVVAYAGQLTWRIAVCALLALVVARPLAVAVALLGSRLRLVTVAFIGWFGPRGLASVLFGLLVLEEQLPGGDELFGVITWTVLASIVLHGVTASFGARRYGAWYAVNSQREDEMAESVHMPTLPTGRARPR